MEEEIMWYGMPRRSGRYPWGSGENPYQHQEDFMARVNELRNKGFDDDDIAKAMSMTKVQLKTQELMIKAWDKSNDPLSEKETADKLGISTGELRAVKSIVESDRRALEKARVMSLKSDGLNPSEIARKLGYSSESSIRALLNEDVARNKDKAMELADLLKKEVAEKGQIEVGKGVEKHLGYSAERMQQALYILEVEGYPVRSVRVSQGGTKGRLTTLNVLQSPGMEYKDAYQFDKIGTIDYHMDENTKSIVPDYVYPAKMNKSRLYIKWDEDGGASKEGLIEVRRGVKDLDLGPGVNYSQVRILVDNGGGEGADNKDRYLKGMCVYGDDKDFPPGVDVIFNTKHSRSEYDDDLGVLKPASKNLKSDKSEVPNPFGSAIKLGISDAEEPYANRASGQSYYIDDNGEKKLSLINKRADEGDWDEWAKKLPSQFLAKQPEKLIKTQLNTALAEQEDELAQIMALDNPVIKKRLLLKYAEGADSTAVHLSAAALPGQRYQVILPLDTIKSNEVYAPNFEDGTKVVLIRFPYGGTFESPELVVNNKNREGIRRLSKTPHDAVGINAEVAAQMSGADFDGDTVMIIPQNPKNPIKVSDPLPGLKDFDHMTQYHGYEGMKILDKQHQQIEMGKVSNLIMDMTLVGASDEERARAVKHSMVVIDANKHELDYRQSYIDNDIRGLVEKYQVHRKLNPDGTLAEEPTKGGASTLITRAKAPIDIPATQGSATIDPETGRLIFKTAKQVLDPETGKWKSSVQKEDGYYYYNQAGDLVKAKDEQSVRNASQLQVQYKVPYQAQLRVRYFDEQGKKTTPVFEKDGKLIFYTGSGNDIQEHEVTDKTKTVWDKPNPDDQKAMKDLIKAGRGTPVTMEKEENVWMTAYESHGKYYFNTGKGENKVVHEVTDDMKTKWVELTKDSSQMATVDDAFLLSSGLKQETAYAEYANTLKALANKARKEYANTQSYSVNKLAKEKYAAEVESLNEKLLQAELNDPRERKALTATAAYMQEVKKMGDYVNQADLQKQEARVLAQMRAKFGASRHDIKITPKEWEAIQAGAISATKLERMANKMDDDVLRQLATPREDKTKITSTMVRRMKAYANSGYTTAQIAEALGVSSSSVLKYIKGKE